MICYLKQCVSILGFFFACMVSSNWFFVQRQSKEKALRNRQAEETMTSLSLYDRHEEETMTSSSLFDKKEKETLTSKSLTNMQEEQTMTSISLGVDQEQVTHEDWIIDSCFPRVHRVLDARGKLLSSLMPFLVFVTFWRHLWSITEQTHDIMESPWDASKTSCEFKSRSFSHALSRLQTITLDSHWLIALYAWRVIGQDLGFINRKPLYWGP